VAFVMRLSGFCGPRSCGVAPRVDGPPRRGRLMLPVSLVRQIDRVTADCDSAEDQLRAVLGLEGSLTEPERD
jgi:hypothetical protein